MSKNKLTLQQKQSGGSSLRSSHRRTASSISRTVSQSPTPSPVGPVGPVLDAPAVPFIRVAFTAVSDDDANAPDDDANAFSSIVRSIGSSNAPDPPFFVPPVFDGTSTPHVAASLASMASYLAFRLYAAAAHS